MESYPIKFKSKRSGIDNVLDVCHWIVPFMGDIGKQYVSPSLNLIKAGRKALKYSDNKPGKRKLRAADGTMYEYEGEISQGEPSGQGLLKDAQGTIIYKGTFRDGEFYGIGEGIGHLNIRYEGVFPITYIYTGELVNGYPDGNGWLLISHEEFKRATKIFNQIGILWIWLDELNSTWGVPPEFRKGYMSVYHGGFRDCTFHGKGDLHTPDGINYDGDFHKGKFHGKGIYRSRKIGGIGGIEGIFDNGVLIKVREAYKKDAEFEEPDQFFIFPQTGFLDDAEAQLRAMAEIEAGLISEDEYQLKRLRREPLTTVSDADAKKIFGLNDKWRPREYIRNNFEAQGTVVMDHATSLVWQKAGSDVNMTYSVAWKYVETLNQKRFAGYDDWRLPTIPELMSLLEPEKQANGLYISPIFETPEGYYHGYWSAHLRTEGESSLESAWIVNFDFGKVEWLSLSNLIDSCVRCVRSGQ